MLVLYCFYVVIGMFFCCPDLGYLVSYVVMLLFLYFAVLSSAIWRIKLYILVAYLINNNNKCLSVVDLIQGVGDGSRWQLEEDVLRTPTVATR